MKNLFSRQSGFTFIEIAAVVAVSSTLAAMSIPMINDFKVQKSMSSTHDAFSRSLNSARETALSSGQSVHLCPSADGVTCAERNWSQGWLVYTGDTEKSAGERVTAADIVEFVQVENGLEVKVFDEALKPVNTFYFNSQGYNAMAQRMTATLCYPEAELKAILVERSGRILDMPKSMQQQSLASLSCSQA